MAPAASKINMPPNSRQRGRHLFDLPQELLDIIFELAFFDDTPLRAVSRKKWAEVHRPRPWLQTRQSDQPFPGCKVSEFLGMGKAYYENACKASIKLRRFNVIGSFSAMTNATERNILCRHVTVAEIDCPFGGSDLFVKKLGDLRSLTTLKCLINDMTFSDLLPQDLCRTLLTGTDMERSKFFNAAKAFRGLKTIELVYRDDDPLRKFPFWNANIAKLQAMLLKEVTQPKPKAAVSASLFPDPPFSVDPTFDVNDSFVSLLISNVSDGAPERPFVAETANGSDEDMVQAFVEDPKGFLQWVRRMKADSEQLAALKVTGVKEG